MGAKAAAAPFERALTVAHPLLTVVEVSADSGRVVAASQRVLQTLDQRAEVLQGLEDLRALVQHGQVRAVRILLRTHGEQSRDVYVLPSCPQTHVGLVEK